MQETIETLNKKIFQILSCAGLDEIYSNVKKLCIDIILHVLNQNYTYFILNKDSTLNKNDIEQIYNIVNCVKSGIPFAYIINQASFYNYDFFVNENVLIPRFDTEVMVDAVIKSVKKDDEVKILDLGCGSGCIGLTIVKEIKKSKVVLVDLSLEALKVTKINSEKLDVAEKSIIIQSDWFDGVKQQNVFDVIVANPPYIAVNDLDIQWNVKQYEPNLALFAKLNGFYNYFKIFRKIKNYMDSNTSLFVEIGWKQYDTIIEIAKKYSLEMKMVHKDLKGVDRVLEFIKK